MINLKPKIPKLCPLIVRFFTISSLEFDENLQAELYSMGTGTKTTVDDLFQSAKRIRHLERAFCVREGMTRETDRLPKCFMDRPIQTGPEDEHILKTDEFEKVMPLADAIYMTRIQNEYSEDPTSEEETFPAYHFKASHLDRIQAHCALLHPLPRRYEIDVRVDQDPRAADSELCFRHRRFSRRLSRGTRRAGG